MRFLALFNPKFWSHLIHNFNRHVANHNSTKKYKRAVKIGSDVSITGECALGREIIVGNNVRLHNVSAEDYTYFSGDSEIVNTSIGKFCSIAPRVVCGLGEHPLKNQVSTHPAFFADEKHKRTIFSPPGYIQSFEQMPKIKIGNDVWIGDGAVIKSGVKIGNGAVVGSRAVVTKDVEPYAIVGGVPAKLIRYRFSSDQIKFLEEFKWWNKSDKWLREHWEEFSNIDAFISKNPLRNSKESE